MGAAYINCNAYAALEKLTLLVPVEPMRTIYYGTRFTAAMKREYFSSDTQGHTGSARGI